MLIGSSKSSNKDLKDKSFAEFRLTLLKQVNFSSIVMPSETIIFLHPPKTAGTNLSYIATALSKINPNFQTTRFSVPRVTHQSPGYISEGWQGGLIDAKAKKQVDPTFCRDINFISGHFPFGLHELLHKSAQYITLIRHPVARELSSANFDFQRGYCKEDNFKHYVLSALDNPQVRMIAGQMSGLCTEKTLNMAKQNIEHNFMLAGVTELANEFIEVLASLQQWGPIAISKAQVTGIKAVEQPSESLVTLLLEKHHFDAVLHDWVKNRWIEWYKTNVKEAIYPTFAKDDKIVCIPPNFATTKTPTLMSPTEVDAYNRSCPEGLVEISQNHTKSDLFPSRLELPAPVLTSFSLTGTGKSVELSESKEKRHSPTF